MENKLISMTDFVLQRPKCENLVAFAKERNSIINYARFLKRPLELGMFVPCNENGNVLQEPKAEDYFNVNIEAEKFTKEDSEGLYNHYSALMFYEKAKERVLFEGFEFHSEDDGFIYLSYGDYMQLVYDIEEKTFLMDTNRQNEYVKSVEDLVKYNLTLTNNA